MIIFARKHASKLPARFRAGLDGDYRPSRAFISRLISTPKGFRRAFDIYVAPPCSTHIIILRAGRREVAITKRKQGFHEQ